MQAGISHCIYFVEGVKPFISTYYINAHFVYWMLQGAYPDPTEHVYPLKWGLLSWLIFDYMYHSC